MLKHIHIAGIGEGLFWFVIVIVTIIVQIIKASKKESQSEQLDQESAKGYTAPQDELQNFLESLTGVPKEPPTRPAAPPPVPAFTQPVQAPPPVVPPAQWTQPRQPAQARLTVRPAAQKRETPPAVPSEPSVQKVKTPQIDAYATQQKDAQFSVRELRNALGSDLISRNMLRKAIVLREILGPPLALRH